MARTFPKEISVCRLRCEGCEGLAYRYHPTGLPDKMVGLNAAQSSSCALLQLVDDGVFTVWCMWARNWLASIERTAHGRAMLPTMSRKVF